MIQKFVLFIFIGVNNVFAFAFNYSTTENIDEAQKNINLSDNKNNITNLVNIITSTLRNL